MYINRINSIFVIEMPRERNGFKPKLCAAYYGRTERLEEAYIKNC